MDVQRVSPSDVMELVCDVTGTSMQVAAALVLRGRAGTSIDLSHLRALVADRITAIPRMRQRLVDAPFGCGRPVWIDDADFDVARHVTSLRCPVPGGEPEMLAVVAELITHRLPADRPLWSATLITGMADGRSVLLVVFHHVLADGIGGLAVLAGLVDGMPPAPGVAFPQPPPRRGDLWSAVVRDRIRAIRSLPRAIGLLPVGLAELGAGRTTNAPRCSLNRPVGTGRALAVARADLDGVRAAAHAQNGTVNDVLLAAVTGALGTVLTQRGEDVDRLIISVPVSGRRQASSTELGNQVGVIPVELPTGDDPVPRLASIARITATRKTATPGASASLIGPAFRILATIGAFGWFIAHQRLINTFVTNLRGPARCLTFAGMPVVDLIAVPMVTGNITVAFAGMSYAGRLTVTVIADPQQCKDLSAICGALQAELDVLTADGPRAKVGVGRSTANPLDGQGRAER